LHVARHFPKKASHFVTVLGEVVSFSLVIEAANRQ
jgi:hypothetical protein